MLNNAEHFYIYRTKKNKTRVLVTGEETWEHGEECMCVADDEILPASQYKEEIAQICPESAEGNQTEETVTCIRQALQRVCQKYPEIDFRFGSFVERFEQVAMKEKDGEILLDHSHYGFAAASARLKKNGQISYTEKYHVGETVFEVPWDSFLEETAELAHAGIATEKLSSGRYKVILRNTVAAEILSFFVAMFEGWNQFSQLAPLYQKVGEKIAVEELNIKEVPVCEYGCCKRAYDDEGTPTQEKYIVEKGIFKAPIHNKESAAKAETISTGNGFRKSPFENVGIGYTNIMLTGQKENAVSADVSLEDLAEEMKEGIIINAIDGAFAGIDCDSGNFSLIAKGEIVREGKKAGSFTDVTISGNILKVFQSILRIGTDYGSAYPSASSVISPSVLVEELVVAGA